MRIGDEQRAQWVAGILDNLRRVFQVVHGYSKRAERIGGLTGPQLWSMKVLAESAPIKVSDLARRMYLRPPTVVGILDRLEQQGLVARTRLTEDNRVVTVTLTAKGKRTVSKVPQLAQGLLLTGLNAMGDRELEVVSEGLALIVGVLGAKELPPQLLFSEEVNAHAAGLRDRDAAASRKPRKGLGTETRPGVAPARPPRTRKSSKI